MTNLRWGAIAGFVYGGLLALFVVIPRTVGRVDNVLPLPLWLVGAIYVAGGLCGGLIAGALSSRIRTWYHAGLAGVLAILPAITAFAVFDSGWSGAADIETIGVVSVLLGFPLGIIMRRAIIDIDPFGDIDL